MILLKSALLDLDVQEIKFGSPLQTESIDLRYRVLREPLGLVFEPNDLIKEYEDFHIAAIVNSKLVGILLLKPIQSSGVLKMRQVAVDSSWQGEGVGKAMVAFSEKFASNKGFEKIELNARQTAIPFYLSLGYVVEGDLFFEVGIPHKKMIKIISVRV